MKALRFDATGSLEALKLATVADPEPGDGEALIAVHAAGLYPSDFKNVLGRFPYTTLPRTPGRDGAGVVLEGPQAWIGLEVWFSGGELGFRRDGSHAERVVLPEAALAAKPAALSFEQAARCGVPLTTALDALDRCAVAAGSRVLIIGAAGAVGRMATQLAAARGARVLAAARRQSDIDALQAAGFDTLALDTAEALVEQAHAVFGDGADVVIDTTGHWLPAAIHALARGGRVAVIAAPDGGRVEVPVLELYRRGGDIVGVNSLLQDAQACARMLSEVAGTMDAGQLALRPPVSAWPLSRGLEAYRALADGSTSDVALRMTPV